MIFSEAFNKNPIVGILRGIEQNLTVDLIQAATHGGVTCVEITMNTDGAAGIIKYVQKHVSGNCCIGAGTVLTIDECKEAIDAGAQYLVTPCTDKAVIEYCNSCSIPVIPGALTPTEVYTAYSCGASLVKVFPVVSMGGPHYIRELRGPFKHIPLVAVSGVTIDKVDDYFKAGVNGIGLGQKLFSPQFIKEKNFYKIRDIAEEYTKAIEKSRSLAEGKKMQSNS